MNIFGKKSEKEWIDLKAYKINGEIYQTRLEGKADVNDLNLSRDELFNKYGVWVSKYSIEYRDFAEWNEIYYESLDAFFKYICAKVPVEINEDEFEEYCNNVDEELKMKFNDFKLDDTLYTCNFFVDGCYLKEIVKVKKKLINESVSNIRNALILEVEILDGKSAVTKREFMKFYDFIRDFKIGCNVKVIDSIDDNFSIDSYFESNRVIRNQKKFKV